MIVSVSPRSQLEGSSDDVELAAAVMNRHVAPFTSIFTIGEELIHAIGKCEAPLLEDTSLSVLAENDIFRDQSRS